MVYIGIDPGKNGAIAIIDTSESINIIVKKYSDENLIDMLSNYHQFSHRAPYAIRCVLEHVHAMPKQGVSSTFTFGVNFGFIQGVLKAYKIPYELVTPQKWKKEFSCTSDKNTSIDVCKRLFPNVNLKVSDKCVKDHDGIAEALLIAEYCRRHF